MQLVASPSSPVPASRARPRWSQAVSQAERCPTLTILASWRPPKSDPTGFVAAGQRPLVIDEIQRGGEPLVRAIKAAAFSPTNTLPLSRWAKMLLLAQALVSVVTVVLVAARAINILPTS